MLSVVSSWHTMIFSLTFGAYQHSCSSFPSWHCFSRLHLKWGLNVVHSGSEQFQWPFDSFLGFEIFCWNNIIVEHWLLLIFNYPIRLNLLLFFWFNFFLNALIPPPPHTHTVFLFKEIDRDNFFVYWWFMCLQMHFFSLYLESVCLICWSCHWLDELGRGEGVDKMIDKK